jgi:hypothetical protein
MVNITKDIRERIAKKAVFATFQPKKDAIVKRENKLAIECYNAVFPKNIRDVVFKVPPEWLQHCVCLRFNVNGWNIYLNAGKQMATPQSSKCESLGTLTGELATRVQDFSQEKKTLEEDYDSAQVKLLGFLEQFRTFKKLKEAWPEGEKFYKEFDVERPSANVPAVITKDINTMLGL